MSKTQKIANIIFVIIVSATLFAVIGYKAVQHAFPALSTPQSSKLEKRDYQLLPKPTLSTIVSGDYQQSFSRFIADDIPLRDDVIILNANLQRSLIELANTPYNFETYPTFFGSEKLYNMRLCRQFAIPTLQSEDLSRSIDEAIQVLCSFFERYSDIRWFLFMLDIDFFSLANPAHDLVTNPADRTYWEDSFFSQLPSSCTCIDGTYDDVQRWREDFFKTNHYWQIQGALAAYHAIVEQLEPTPIKFEDLFEADSGEFWGS